MTSVATVVERPVSDEAQLLFKEARRRRRRRWTIGTVVLLAGLSTGTWAVIAGLGHTGRAGSATSPAPASLLGLPVDVRAYRACPGSARVGPATSPDGLPAQVSDTGNLSLASRDARNMSIGPYFGFTHPVAGLPGRSDVKTIRVGAGGGYVWKRESSGKVAVVHVKNYGIDVFLKASSQCPTGGWVRWVDGGFQVTFLAPKA